MTRLVTLIVAVLVSAGGLAHAEQAALLPVSGINVHEGYLAAAQSVARDHLEQNGFQVIVVPGAPGSQEIAGAEAARTAGGMGARYAVVVHVLRLGNSAKIKLTAYDVPANVVAYRGSLTAASPDELDAVMARLVKGMVTGDAPTDTGEIDTVTLDEADPHAKVQATSVFGVRLGSIMPLNGPDGAGDPLAGIGVFWLYDVRSFLADVSLDLHSSDDDKSAFNVSLGAYYPLNRTNTTPYVGGGLRYGMTDFGGEGATGMAAYGAVGILFGRLSSVQLRGELAFFQNFFREEEIDADGDVDRSRNNGIVVSAGIGF